MKGLILLALVFIGLNTNAQTANFSAALSGGTDFKGGLTTVGLDMGAYFGDRTHSILFTVNGEAISNEDLILYHRDKLVRSEITNSRESITIGLKYAIRVLSVGDFDLRGIVHPWYSTNLSIKSAYIGGRVDLNHRSDMVGVELVKDALYNRYVLRLVFTGFQNK